MIETLQALFFDGFFLCLTLSLFLILSRLKTGPSLADRVVALDLFSTLLISAIVATAIYVPKVIYLDVAIIFALFNFFGTVVFAYFIQKQGKSR